MARAVVTIGLALALGGCASVPQGHMSLSNPNAIETTYVLPVNPQDGTIDTVGSFGEGSTYMIAVPVDDGWCYTRVIAGLPLDQICQFGELIRYSPDAPLATSLRPVPGYILGLFDTLASADALRPELQPEASTPATQ